MVPKTQNFPSGVSYCNQLFTLNSVKKYIDKITAIPEMITIDNTPLENTQVSNQATNKFLQVKSVTATTKDARTRLTATTATTNNRTISKNEDRLGMKKQVDNGLGSPDPLKQKGSKEKENFESPQLFKVRKNNLVEIDRFEQSRKSDFDGSTELIIRGGFIKPLTSTGEPTFGPFHDDAFEDSRLESSAVKKKGRRTGSVEIEPRASIKSNAKTLTKENPNNTTQTSNSTATTGVTRKTRKDTANVEDGRSSRGQSYDSTLKSAGKLFRGPKTYNLELTTTASNSNKFESSMEGGDKVTPTGKYKAKKQNPWADNEITLMKKASRQNLHNTLNKEELKSSEGTQSAAKKKSPSRQTTKSSQKQPPTASKTTATAKKRTNSRALSPKTQQQIQLQLHQQNGARQSSQSDPRNKFSTLSRNGRGMPLPSTLEVVGDDPSQADDIESIEENLEYENNSTRSFVSSTKHNTDQHWEEKKEFMGSDKRSINELLLRGEDYQQPNFGVFTRGDQEQDEALDKSFDHEDEKVQRKSLSPKETKKKKDYEAHLNQVVNQVRPYSPPFSSVMTSMENCTRAAMRKPNQEGLSNVPRSQNAQPDASNADSVVYNEGETDQNGELVEVIYDPVLNCYYNPKTDAYYELKVE